MTHATEGVLQAYLDDELSPQERADLAAHVAQCASCARELEALDAASQDLTALLRSIDVTVSVEEARQAFERARWLERSRRARRVLGRAAVLTLFVAGAAAAAVPGSPLRRWVSDLLGGAATSRVSAPAATPAPAPAAPAAVSIRPLDGRVSVVVRDAAPGTRVHVELLDSDLASVEGRGAAVGKFETSPGRIEVSAPQAGDVIVALPHDANATVALNGRVVLRKEGQTLRVLEAPVKRSEHELIFEPRR